MTEDVTVVTDVDSQQIGDAQWYFARYQPGDVDATWWQIGESEKDCAYFDDEREAWEYWNKILSAQVKEFDNGVI